MTPARADPVFVGASGRLLVIFVMGELLSGDGGRLMPIVLSHFDRDCAPDTDVLNHGKECR